MGSNQKSTGVGVLNEKPLHAALKIWYAQPGDRVEEKVDGYIIDIVQDELLVEIQTGNFSAIKRKLINLTNHHPIRLVYPIAREKWIVKIASKKGESPTRRKSPKRGRVEEIFNALVSFPKLMSSDNFSLEVLMIQEEEVRRYDRKRNWRKKGWKTEERRLLKVVEQHLFETPDDLWNLVRDYLPEQFTTTDLAEAMKMPRRLAQQTAYCLRGMGAIELVGKRGRSNLYARPNKI